MEANGVGDDHKMLYFGLEPPQSDTSVATDNPEVYTNGSDESNNPLNPPMVEDTET